MEIIILDIRPQNGGRPLKAFVDLKLGDLTIRDFRVIQQRGERAFVTAPQTSWKSPDGAIKYKTIITMPNDLKWQIESAVLAEFQRAQEKRQDGIS
jgi:DNA-binding cell septation regulator SpoVG